MNNKDFYKALGAALREQREAKNLSQQYIADKLGVSKMTVSRWESGQRTMSAKHFLRYCQVVDVNADYIFDRT